MSDKLDFARLAADVLSVLQQHGLSPDKYGVSMSIPKGEFDEVAADHPGHNPEIIIVTASKWYVQIARHRELSDYPPGAIWAPPPDT